MADTNLKLTPGMGGWLHADWGDGAAWVRFDRDEQGKLTRITELHVLDPTPEKLRRIPLARIHHAATAKGAGLVQLMLAVGFKNGPPAEMLSTPPEQFGELVADKVMAETPDPETRFRLRRPAGRKLDDGFFEDVARAYRDAISRGLRPRPTLAIDARVKPDTVAGWVSEARRRGHLPPTSPGRVSAGD